MGVDTTRNLNASESAIGASSRPSPYSNLSSKSSSEFRRFWDKGIYLGCATWTYPLYKLSRHLLGLGIHEIQITHTHYTRGRLDYYNAKPIELDSLLFDNIYIYYEHKSLAFILSKRGFESKCRIFADIPHAEDNKVTLSMQVYWDSSDPKSLESPEALREEFVTSYLLLGSQPFNITASPHLPLIENNKRVNICDLTIPDTFDIIPCEQLSSPFKIKLYDYQLRTLAWMQGVEDGDESLYYAPNVFPIDDERSVCVSPPLLASNEEIKSKRKAICGGIIAVYFHVNISYVTFADYLLFNIQDKPGIGKTITTIALCHTRPFAVPDDADEDYLYNFYTVRDSSQPKKRILSKATLILVPNNIGNQWAEEFRKCLGDKVNILQIKGKREYQKTCVNDIMNADAIIVTYNFLKNPSYPGTTANERILEGTKLSKLKVSIEEGGGNYSLSWFQFHRIVYDEFHEIPDRHRYIQNHIYTLSAESIWGLTGTPRLENLDSVMTCAEFLNLKPSEVWRNQEYEGIRFIKHRVRRNEPVINFPDPIHETISVSQTPAEFSLYRSHLRSSAKMSLLMLCNHYQITLSAEGDQLLSIEKVAQRVQSSRATHISRLTAEINQTVSNTTLLQHNLDVGNGNPNDLNDLLFRAQNKLTRIQNDLRVTQAQYNYFKNFAESYADGTNDTNCAVCLEDRIVNEDAGVLPCGHAFCWECANNVATANRSCPTCRERTFPQDIMLLSPHINKESLPKKYFEGVGTLDPNLFGSKIRELVDYIYDAANESASARFIVFIQFGNLADIVSNALRTYGINNVRLRQGWQARESALRKFKDSVIEEEAGILEEAKVTESDMKGKRKAADVNNSSSKTVKTKDGKVEANGAVKVMILSAKDSVSGLNLTEASHCIILHPFYSEKEDYAIAAEKQGIARVLRNGQTKTVKIVRMSNSVILEEEFDENYEPSEEEVIEYAKFLGMDPENEKELLWIARQSLKAPLPADWKPCQTEDGNIYYFNFNTGESIWDHPCDEEFRKLYAKEKEKLKDKKSLGKPNLQDNLSAKDLSAHQKPGSLGKLDPITKPAIPSPLKSSIPNNDSDSLHSDSASSDSQPLKKLLGLDTKNAMLFGKAVANSDEELKARINKAIDDDDDFEISDEDESSGSAYKPSTKKDESKISFSAHNASIKSEKEVLDYKKSKREEFETQVKEINEEYARKFAEAKEKEQNRFESMLKELKANLSLSLKESEKEIQLKSETSATVQKLMDEEEAKLKTERAKLEEKFRQQRTKIESELESAHKSEIENLRKVFADKLTSLKEREQESMEKSLNEWKSQTLKKVEEEKKAELQKLSDTHSKKLQELERSQKFEFDQLQRQHSEKIQEMRESVGRKVEVQKSEVEDSLHDELNRVKEKGHNQIEKMKSEFGQLEGKLKEDEKRMLNSYQEKQVEIAKKLKILEDELTSKKNQLELIESQSLKINKGEVDEGREELIQSLNQQQAEREKRLNEEKEKMDVFEKSLAKRRLELLQQDEAANQQLMVEIAQRQRKLIEEKETLLREEKEIRNLRTKLKMETEALQQLEKENIKRSAWIKETNQHNLEQGKPEDISIQAPKPISSDCSSVETNSISGLKNRRKKVEKRIYSTRSRSKSRNRKDSETSGSDDSAQFSSKTHSSKYAVLTSLFQ
ncbi:hypothetical protein HK098_003766 [Nowakowskiella sp. JEL0407]|nr:hypothetical protein HK098_003766 [Nowakowskiella sp. JEL0407]